MARLEAQENNGLKPILNGFGFPTSKMKARAPEGLHRGHAFGGERRHHHRALSENPTTLRFHLKPQSPPPPIKREPLLPGLGTARPGHTPGPSSRFTLPPRKLRSRFARGCWRRPGQAGRPPHFPAEPCSIYLLTWGLVTAQDL